MTRHRSIIEAGVRYTPAACGAMIAAHRKLAEAIIAKDAAGASRVMTVHLEATQAYIARYYPGLIDNPVTLVSRLPQARPQ